MQGYQSKPQHPNQSRNTEKKTLVIGDSMVKNIEEKKIERAARGKTVCHSYSGAMHCKSIAPKFNRG